MMVVLTELYPFIPFSVTLIIFQGHSSLKQYFYWKLCILIQLSWNLYDCGFHQVDNEHTTVFDFLHMFKGDSWYISLFEKNFGFSIFEWL